MQQVIKELQKLKPWKESMRKTCRINKLNIDIASYFTPLRFRDTYAKFQTIYDKKGQQKEERWIQNQLKAFYWMCVLISCITSIKIANFTTKELQILYKIFYFKQPITVEYQIKKLNDQSDFKHNWQPQQQQLLTEIIKKHQGEPFKWNEYARQLYQLSNKLYCRTGKQCRQRWLNHLDPQKEHGEWSLEEDKKFIELYLTDGRKWSQIARKLGKKRTQHMIKNRYKAILTKQKKIHPRIKVQSILIKSFLNVNVAEQYYQRNNSPNESFQMEKKEKIQKNYSEEEIIQEQKSDQLQQLQLQQQEQEQQQNEKQQADKIKANNQEKQKYIPKTSSTFQLSQAYSPWMYYNHHIAMTPNYSPSLPFFINLSSFSAFQAFSANQFCNNNSINNNINSSSNVIFPEKSEKQQRQENS